MVLFLLQMSEDALGIHLQGVEEEFKIERSFHACLVGRDDGLPAHGGLAVEAIGRDSSRFHLLEAEAVADFLHRLVQLQVAAADTEDVVEQELDVAHLVRGDDNRSVLGGMAGNDFPELTLGGNVKAIGRLVHEENARVGGQGEADKGLLLLAHGHRAEVEVEREVKLLETCLQNLLAEAGIEGTVKVDVFAQRDMRHIHLLGQDHDFAQQFGLAQLRFLPIAVLHLYHDIALLRAQQARKEIEQRALARSVLAQKTVDAAGLQRKRKVV